LSPDDVECGYDPVQLFFEAYSKTVEMLPNPDFLREPRDEDVHGRQSILTLTFIHKYGMDR
jgi:hypothetical protein